MTGSDLQYPEVGYTPANLLAWIRHYQLSREEVSRLMTRYGHKTSTRAVDSWVLPLSSKQRRNMPHQAWAMLQSFSDLEIDTIRESS